VDSAGTGGALAPGEDDDEDAQDGEAGVPKRSKGERVASVRRSRAVAAKA